MSSHVKASSSGPLVWGCGGVTARAGIRDAALNIFRTAAPDFDLYTIFSVKALVSAVMSSTGADIMVSICLPTSRHQSVSCDPHRSSVASFRDASSARTGR